MSNSGNILFIDDELFFAQPYVEALQQVFGVAVRTSALEAVEELTKRPEEYSCAIVDIMMPPPEKWEPRTKDGLDTGIEILRRCRDQIIATNLPIVVLTHRALPYVRDETAVIDFPDGLVKFCSKLETPPEHLQMIVERLVHRWEKRPSS